MMKIRRSLLAGAGVLALTGVPAFAQQVNGVPGSPGATTTKLTFKLEPEAKAVTAGLGPTEAPEPDPIEEAKQ